MTSQSDEPEASDARGREVLVGDSPGRELWDEVRIEPVEIALPGRRRADPAGLPEGRPS